MSFQNAENVWDFTPVIDLNYSLSFNREVESENESLSSPSWGHLPTPTFDVGGDENRRELGNFDKIWDFLGLPPDVPPLVTSPSADETLTDLLDASIDSTDPILGLPASKYVKWRDEVGQAGIADKVDIENAAVENVAQLKKALRSKLSAKKRGKKAKRREKKANVASRDDAALTLASSSENVSGLDAQNAPPLQARMSVIWNLLYGTTSRKDIPMQEIGSATRSTSEGLGPAKGSVTTHRCHLRSTFKTQEQAKQAKQAVVIGRYPLRSTHGSQESSLDDLSFKRNRLLARLTDRFVSEKLCISRLSLVSFAENVQLDSESGLHVFVDASNIMIGFHDALKISRGLAIASRIGRQPISFHHLSIVLERGRPTAKRVLVGSDNFPSIQEAKKLGYETNILDRVRKAKELTPRQMKYRNVNGATSSGSETTAAMYAPEKWVEQAVDEILHMKILESVCDAKKPSTMVLASGDAAEAEYSQGFLAQVERALSKGWNVEVCSFRKNISGSYRKKEFRAKWGSQFKLIEMDDFVEELLGVE